MAKKKAERQHLPNTGSEKVPPEAYGSFHGGAVGGTPAQGREKGGRVGRGIRPDTGRHTDSTVGSKPETPSD